MELKINALTVSVNYHDELKLLIPRWAPFLSSWTIVTKPEDVVTVQMASDAGLRCHQTSIFTANGATFNKGGALEEARKCMPWSDWILLLDSDIVPEAGWYERLKRETLASGNLYSAARYQCNNYRGGYAAIDDPTLGMIRDDLGVGYFQLFHSSDPHASVPPGGDLIEPFWLHAGNYDDRLKVRWERLHRRALSIRLVHLGDSNNWFGKGNHEAMRRMRDERLRRGGRWDHERIGIPQDSGQKNSRQIPILPARRRIR